MLDLINKSDAMDLLSDEAKTAGLKCFASRAVVPNEVDITGLVEFIALEDGASVRAQKTI